MMHFVIVLALLRHGVMQGAHVAVTDAIVLHNVLFQTDDGEQHGITQVGIVVTLQMNDDHADEIVYFVLYRIRLIALLAGLFAGRWRE